MWCAAAGAGRNHFAFENRRRVTRVRSTHEAVPRNELVYLFFCDRRGNEVSLTIDIFDCLDPCELIRRFDTFYDDSLPESLSKPDQRFDDDSRIRIVLNIAHEPAVQLQCVDAETVKNGERPATRAEVVDCNAYTTFP